MLVRMRAGVSGLRDGKPWPLPGHTIDLPTDEAVRMCENGSAEPVYDPMGDVERAVAPGAEVRDVVVESTGHVDTSARDALVKTIPKPPRRG